MIHVELDRDGVENLINCWSVLKPGRGSEEQQLVGVFFQDIANGFLSGRGHFIPWWDSSRCRRLMNPGLLPAIDGFQPFAQRNLVANVVAKNRNGGVTLLSKVLLAVAEDYVSHMTDYQWVTIDFELVTPYWWDDSATIRNVSAVLHHGSIPPAEKDEVLRVLCSFNRRHELRISTLRRDITANSDRGSVILRKALLEQSGLSEDLVRQITFGDELL